MDILKEIKKRLPSNAGISDTSFEGSDIVLYTNNREFFLNNGEIIRSLVSRFKKRIEVRSDPAVLMEENAAEEAVRKLVTEDAGLDDIYFEPDFAKMIIVSSKPGLVIGKNGSTLREIKSKTLWAPQIVRAPAIDSKVVKTIRKTLHSESKYRKKFLDNVGKFVHGDKKNIEWVRFTALGGYRQVGRSCTLLHTPDTRIMIDCGIDVSSDSFPYLQVPEFQIEKLDAIVISHAHLDHSGFAPFLYEHGFKGPLYCTEPTRDLAALLHLDYVDICQREGKEVPYSSKGIKGAIRHCIPLRYGEVTDITPDIRLTLENAGHLLGSSLVHLHIGEGMYNLLYACDIRYDYSRLFDPAFTQFRRVETAIIESTYGGMNDLQSKRQDSEKQLLDYVINTVKKGGRVLIPSFAVGRSQEIMLILVQSEEFRKLGVKIHLDGMIWDATAIHTAYPEYMGRDVQKQIFHNSNNPFLSEVFHTIGSHTERMEVIENREPCVVIATSGMLIGGPAIEYLKNFCSDKKNTLLFVGYQGEGSLGRKIQKGWRDIPLSTGRGRTETLRIEMQIETVEGLSGHSDKNHLVKFIGRLPQTPERIVTCHGDPRKCVSLAKTMYGMYKTETIAPRNLETLRLR